MAAYKFLYFPIRGRGEAIRLLLSDNDISYDEIDTSDKWVEKWKPEMVFGQVPRLDDGDFQLVQFNAILRYLGRKHDLYGSSIQEAARVDMITDGVEDLRGAYVKLIYQNYKEGKVQYCKDLPGRLEPFENLLKSGGDYILGDKISFADYNLFDLLDIHQVLSPGCLSELPTLKAFYDRVLDRPKIQAYRKTEGFITRNINGNANR